MNISEYFSELMNMFTNFGNYTSDSDLNKLTKEELIKLVKKYQEEQKKMENIKDFITETSSDFASVIKSGIVEGLKPVLSSLQTDLRYSTDRLDTITKDLVIGDLSIRDFKKDFDDLKRRASIITKYNEECDRFNKLDFDREVLDNTSKSHFTEKFDPFTSTEDIIEVINSNLEAQTKCKNNQVIFNQGFNRALNQLYTNIPHRIYNKYVDNKIRVR